MRNSRHHLKLFINSFCLFNSRNSFSRTYITTADIAFLSRKLNFSAPVKIFRTAIITLILFIVGILNLQAQTVTLTSIADNDMFFADPSKNYGGYFAMYVIQGSSMMDRSMVKFDLSGIPTSATITSATLTLVKLGVDNKTINIATHQITNSWTEGTGGGSGTNGVSNWNQRITGTNWTTAGGDYNPVAETTTSVSNNGTYTWNIPVMVQNWVTTPGINHGVLLKSATETGSNIQHAFATREYSIATDRPKLVVTYTTTPTISTSAISPTTYCAGSSVNIPFTITGNFTGGNVFTAQLSDASGSFASPVSIGTLNSTMAGTISATIPLGISAGTSYRIRVVSNNPIVTGLNNGSNLTVNKAPSGLSYTFASPNYCIGVPITTNSNTLTTIGFPAPTYSVSPALPSGLTLNSSTGAITGTPILSAVATAYTISATNTCGTTNAIITITVTPNKTVAAASSNPTLCINTLMTNITHATTLATGIGIATGLPSGITASFASNTITISGTPTASGIFNYTIPLTGGCGTVNATGTITVTANMTVSAASSTPSLCINTLMTNITHSTTLATGIGTATGLPTGITASFASNTITISGTPTTSGIFNYTIPLTGGCGTVNAIGTITVNILPSITGTTPGSRCGTGTVSLGATSSAGTINWYANSTGGLSLGTGTSFTTPSISTTTIYWIDATSNGCSTASRTSITATVTKNYWNGVANTNWNDSSNWCAGVPTAGVANTLDVVIPSGLTNYPVIFSGDPAGYVKSIILENNTTLIVMENSIRVIENLKLDGKIDLEGESQLLQDIGSTLDPTSSGSLERDQQGTADTHTYNYWSSPVSKINTLSNNVDYKVTDVFKDVNFLTSGYNGTAGTPIGIADYWIWKFSNLTSGDYSKWQHIRSNGILLVGEGFTMKGPGTGSISTPQNYVFLGKPNNGDINLNITAGNDYLVGNPYPSALDADQFILDNDAVIGAVGGSITGTLYFWQHWGGATHLLNDYQGGYATYTLAGGIPGPFMGIPPPGFLKTPGRYIPIAQGFFVTAETNGTIKFNNGQRVFRVEDGIYSLFVKSANTKKTQTSNNQYIDTREKIRLGFNSVNTIYRQLLATVDPKASIRYDRGYDAPYIDALIDDMYWLIDNSKYTIQGLDKITEQTILPLGIHTKTNGLNSINIDKIENESSNLKIYIHDKQLNLYHDLKESNYNVYLDAGAYLNRFEITFSNSKALGLENLSNIDIPIEVYFLNKNKNLIIENPGSKHIKSIEMFNLLGQFMYKFEPETNKNHLEYHVSQIKMGLYIFNINTEFGKITKKVLIK